MGRFSHDVLRNQAENGKRENIEAKIKLIRLTGGQKKGEYMKYQEGLDNLLKNVIVIRNAVAERIARLPEGKINTYLQTKRGKTYISYAQIMDNGKRIYITKDTQKIIGLTTKLFLTINLELIDQYINALRETISTAERISMQEILEKLPEELKTFLHFDEGKESVTTQEAKLRKKAEDFMKEEYLPYVFSDTQTRHITSDGTIVRSKSELIIYELLLQYHITFRYEKPIIIGGVEYRPDFTILLPDGRVIYWEHAGMMIKEEYRERHKKKMNAFESAGIVPWDNLIVTYDDRYGNININLIISEIKNKLLA